MYGILLHQKISQITACTCTEDSSPPIAHRSMEYQYTKYLFTYSRMHIYLGQMYPHPNYPQMYGIPLHQICFNITVYTYIDYRSECTYTYTYGRWTPPQLTIDIWNTATPKSFTNSTMHMYLGQMYPTIDHRCMEYHFTE